MKRSIFIGCCALMFACTACGGNSAIEETPAVTESERVEERIDLTEIIYFSRSQVIDTYGQPNSTKYYYSEEDPTMDYEELYYDDFVVQIASVGDMQAVCGLQFLTTEDRYTMFGIYNRMTKEELQNHLDSALTLYTDMEYSKDPFDDGDVTYRIAEYDAFMKVYLKDDVVEHYEYIFPLF